MPVTYTTHFRRRDPVLHAVAKRVGPYALKPARDRFGMLVRSILSQQISTSAARSIRAKLENLVGKRGIKPATIRSLSLEELRSVGLSRQKASYLHDLAAKADDGTIRLARIARLGDEEVITELTQVNGIGRWTAQMFLIFSLGREDVFPAGDFGVKAAIQKLYGYNDLPDRDQLAEIQQRWTPYATIGSWYCWRYLDLLAAERNGNTSPKRKRGK
jgi:DNA-3-methyladenine glycosylase II